MYIIILSYCLITVPAPVSIVISSNKPNPIRPVGSAVTLNCIVVLSPAIDVLVSVNISLSDPAGRTLTATTPSVSGTTYTTSTAVDSFGRNQSGIYACTASINSTIISPFIIGSQLRTETARITTGETNT